ncbi:MAG: hypothetical protein JWQ96_1940 [Segetibacter sp.]|nr:hypothetical protein [Segetibacter sp.]
MSNHLPVQKTAHPWIGVIFNVMKANSKKRGVKTCKGELKKQVKIIAFYFYGSRNSFKLAKY